MCPVLSNNSLTSEASKEPCTQDYHRKNKLLSCFHVAAVSQGQNQLSSHDRQQLSANFKASNRDIQCSSGGCSPILSGSTGNRIWLGLRTFSSLFSIDRRALLLDNLDKGKSTLNHESEVIFGLKAKLELSDKRRLQFS